MSTINSRNIHISQGSAGLVVVLSWMDTSMPKGMRYQMVEVQERNNVTMHELREKLNDLGVTWWISEISEHRFGIVGDFPKALSSLFDQAVKDCDPVIALLTPYEVVVQPHQEPADVSQS